MASHFISFAFQQTSGTTYFPWSQNPLNNTTSAGFTRANQCPAPESGDLVVVIRCVVVAGTGTFPQTDTFRLNKDGNATPVDTDAHVVSIGATFEVTLNGGAWIKGERISIGGVVSNASPFMAISGFLHFT
jgi:hypothetical protein